MARKAKHNVANCGILAYALAIARTTPLGEDTGMKIKLVSEYRELVRWRWTAGNSGGKPDKYCPIAEVMAVAIEVRMCGRQLYFGYLIKKGNDEKGG